jgi:hypothetical protein
MKTFATFSILLAFPFAAAGQVCMFVMEREQWSCCLLPVAAHNLQFYSTDFFIFYSLQNLRRKVEDAIDCQLFVADGRDNVNDIGLFSFLCVIETEKGLKTVEIDLPTDFVDKHQERLWNTPVLRILGGVVHTDALLLSDDAEIVIIANKSAHRRLAPTSGQPNALSVRIVTSGGEEPKDSFDVLRGQVMGYGPLAQTHTFRSQYENCSFGAQQIQAATSEDGNGIVDGVVEVQVDFNIGDGTCNILGTCQDDIIAQTEAVLGVPLSHFDFVMFCVPDGGTFGANGAATWAAFAYGGSNVSFCETTAVCICSYFRSNPISHVCSSCNTDSILSARSLRHHDDQHARKWT